MGTANVGSYAPACPPFIVALRERGPTAIHGRRPRSGRGSDRFPDPEITFLTCFTYLSLTISCQIPSLLSKYHHHLYKRLIFIFLRSLIPKPPFFLDLQTLFHLTRWYFFFNLPPCQKNLLLIFFIFLIVVLGRRNMDIW
jgi:hypothetical protein